MTFISYAQNFEDVMLWRALKHVDRGFYIDIGAQDPIVDSVSLAFFEHGWRGVHIEPTLQYSNKLRNARPDECVEQVAVGNFQETLNFYEFTDTGLSTADPDVAKRHQDAGFVAIRTEVAVVPLDVILSKYGDQNINWLKIDVEGLEKSVLESWSVSTVRPWILIIESTKPLTQDQSYSDWESLVLNKGYCFAYFDGLNRFYVHQDHHELLQSFVVPPNIFDGFVLSGCASHPFYQVVAGKAQQAEAKAQQAEAKAQQAEAASTHALSQLHAVHASTSWRLTGPLRWTGHQLQLLKQHGVETRLEAPFKRVLRCLLAFAHARPALKKSALVGVKKLGLEPLLRRIYTAVQSSASYHIKFRALPADKQQLSPHARQIYADLKTAIEKNKRTD